MTFKDFLKEFDAALDNTEDLSADELKKKAMQLRRLEQLKRTNPERAKQMQQRQLGDEMRSAETPQEKTALSMRRRRLQKQQTEQPGETM